ncbi:MAG: hypothetical protein LBU46_06070 [Candidatus Accumulibacter sp.]|jgi:hypothetical protein|nr:hypothetical protein [Accumulibacter sp.]
MSRLPPAVSRPDDLFGNALRHLDPPPTPADNTGQNGFQDGFLYSGNRHESVPRALFFDRRLTPLERNAWQVCRLRLNGDGVTVFPTYEELRPLLSSMPCAPKASHETVARAMSLLRLTRWLSLVRQRRDLKTGRIQGNLYVLHDEPLTPFEALQIDPEYLSLLSRALTHASKAVRLVGTQVLRELGDDPLLAGRVLPSRLQILMQRLAKGLPIQETYPQDEAPHDSEEGKKDLLRNGESPSSASETGLKPAPDAFLRHPKQDSTVLSTVLINKKEVRTVPRAREGEGGGQLPRRFLELKEEQQAGAWVALRQVDKDQRQAVLDEWDARCRDGRIRHPAGYLFGIIQKALRGEFKAWAGQCAGQGASVTSNLSSEADDPVEAASKPASSEAAREYLAHIRAMLGGAPSLPGPS